MNLVEAILLATVVIALVILGVLVAAIVLLGALATWKVVSCWQLFEAQKERERREQVETIARREKAELDKQYKVFGFYRTEAELELRNESTSARERINRCLDLMARLEGRQPRVRLAYEAREKLSSSSSLFARETREQFLSRATIGLGERDAGHRDVPSETIEMLGSLQKAFDVLLPQVTQEEHEKHHRNCRCVTCSCFWSHIRSCDSCSCQEEHDKDQERERVRRLRAQVAATQLNHYSECPCRNCDCFTTSMSCDRCACPSYDDDGD